MTTPEWRAFWKKLAGPEACRDGRVLAAIEGLSPPPKDEAQLKAAWREHYRATVPYVCLKAEAQEELEGQWVKTHMWDGEQWHER